MEQKDQLPRSFAETAQKIELGGSLVPGDGAGSAAPGEGAGAAARALPRGDTWLRAQLLPRRSARTQGSRPCAGSRARPDQGSSSAVDRSVRTAPFYTGVSPPHPQASTFRRELKEKIEGGAAVTATKSANPGVHGGVAERVQGGGPCLTPCSTASARTAAGGKQAGLACAAQAAARAGAGVPRRRGPPARGRGRAPTAAPAWGPTPGGDKPGTGGH